MAAAEHARIGSGKPDASGGGGDQRKLVARGFDPLAPHLAVTSGDSMGTEVRAATGPLTGCGMASHHALL